MKNTWPICFLQQRIRGEISAKFRARVTASTISFSSLKPTSSPEISPQISQLIFHTFPVSVCWKRRDKLSSFPKVALQVTSLSCSILFSTIALNQ